MRSYELIAIFPTEEELLKAGKNSISDELKKHGGSIEKEEDMGERQLQYPVRKRQRGHYFLFNVNVAAEVPALLEKTFKLNPNILKHLFVRADQKI